MNEMIQMDNIWYIDKSFFIYYIYEGILLYLHSRKSNKIVVLQPKFHQKDKW